MSACITQNETDGSSVEEKVSTSNVVDAGELVESEQVSFEETVEKLTLPEQYASYNTFIAADEEWYFLADYSQLGLWKYVKVSRTDFSDVRELSVINTSYATIMYAWNGDLYINTFEHVDSFTCYTLYQLSEGEANVVLEGKCKGYPEMAFSGEQLVISCLTVDGETILETYDMESQKRDVVYSASGIHFENKYNVYGNVVNGFFWPRSTSSANGFCYMVSDMSGRAYDDGLSGNDSIYYYDFATKESSKLVEHQYVADYIGGTDDIFLVSDYNGQENMGKSEFLYIYNGATYDKYRLKYGDVYHDGFNGFGSLEYGRYIAYSGMGFLIIDAENKTFLEKIYSVRGRDPEIPEDLDYEGAVRRYYYADQCYYFSETIEGQVYIHVIE